MPTSPFLDPFLTFSGQHGLLERLDPGVHVLEAAGQLLVHAVHVAREQRRGQGVRPGQLVAGAGAYDEVRNGKIQAKLIN